MAIPRVFVSSTCYDLRYIRENLKFFIKNMGFEPILSEDGSVYYDPALNVQDACLAEIPNCQLFVLIIGGRFGSNFRNKESSIVNQEYRKAVEMKVPIFAMVEQQVHAEYRVYLKNKTNNQINYPGVDSTKVFDFMTEVEGKAFNNALVPFVDYNKLETYLKKQWAGLMFSFLTKRAESERVADMLETLTIMSNRIEFLSKQILSSVGQDIEKINALLYDIMSNSSLMADSKMLELRAFSPFEVLEHEKFDLFLVWLGCRIRKKHNSEIEIIKRDRSTTISSELFAEISLEYEETRQKMLSKLEENGLSKNEFIKAVKTREVVKKL